MKDGAGRSLAAAAGVAALCAASIGYTAGELGDPSAPSTPPSGTGPSEGWKTQYWPMHGQRGDQRRRITEDFTRARYRNSSSSLEYPHEWAEFKHANGEVVTSFANGLGLVGPQGVWAVTSSFATYGQFICYYCPCAHISVGSGMYVGLGTGPWIDDAYLNGPNSCEQMPLSSLITLRSPCGTYSDTPLLVPDPTIIQAETGSGTTPVGFLHVYGVTAGCGAWSVPDQPGSTGRLVQKIVLTAYASIRIGPGLPVTTAYGTEWDSREFPLVGNPWYAPALEDDIIYVATAREDADGNPGSTPNQDYGFVYAINRGSLEGGMNEVWHAGLQLGSESTGPLPKGQEPPPAAERYHPTTPVAVGQHLVVVGCVRYIDDYSFGYLREIQSDHALFVFDSRTGALRFTYKVDSEILPTPAITDELVIFGTKNGRAYAVQHSDSDASLEGRLKWQVEWANRITYRVLPYSTPQQFADAALYGPAIDSGGDFAYFGGTDGRVHQFSVSGGSLTSSPVLMYFREAEMQPWGFNVPRDANGLVKIRPCPISAAPAIWRSRTLLVRTHTNTQGPDPDEGNNHGRNSSFLCALHLPTMTMNPNISVGRDVRLDMASAEFHGYGDTWGAVSANGYTSAGFLGWDSINQVSFINDPGDGAKFEWNVIADKGGVSIGDGYAFLTDGSDVVFAVPSDDNFTPAAPAGTVNPHNPTAGPPPNPGPLPLGPVEAFPNPFMPARAKGGTFKFRNLPTGSRIELYTLAFERVKTLVEAGNRAEWNATNEAGQPVVTGVYLYKIFLPGDVPPITGRVALTR